MLRDALLLTRADSIALPDLLTAVPLGPQRLAQRRISAQRTSRFDDETVETKCGALYRRACVTSSVDRRFAERRLTWDR